MTGQEAPKHFAVVRISSPGIDLVTEFTAGVFGYATTSGSKRVEEDSYAHMNVTKECLCKYISALEEFCGIRREITLRF